MPDRITHQFETFRKLGNYEIRQHQQDEPSCFNSVVRVRRYRITVEEIDESKEVIQQRLIRLWEEGNNHHHMQPLLSIAKGYGLDLRKYKWGSKRGKQE